MSLISINPEDYETQLTSKLTAFSERFSKFYSGDIEIFRSKPEYYRMRAEFRVWHENDSLGYWRWFSGRDQQ